MELTSVLQSGDLATYLVACLACCFIYAYYFRNRLDIPGPFALPFLGNFFTLVLQRNRNVLYRLQKIYGNIFRVYFGRRLVVVICGKDLINDAFIKQADSFSDRPNGMSGIKKKMEPGLIWSNGHTWKVLRRFTVQSMRDFGLGKKILEERILEECNVVLREMANTESQPFSIRDLYRNAVSNVTHTIIFGKRCDYNDPEFRDVIDSISLIFNMSLGGLSPTTIWPFLKLFIKDEAVTRWRCLTNITNYIEAQVKEHESSFDEENIRDFIDAYLQAKKNDKDTDIITPKQLFRVILNLFNAGTDTTAASLDWSALYMISYPDVQEKCQREIDEIVGHGRKVQMSDKSQLPYVEATLLEIQRLANVAIASLPHVATRDSIVGGYRIPEGAIVLAHLQLTHEDSSCWDDPLAFKPDRFLDSDGKIRKYDAFMPFSIGPRACPGDSLAKKVMFLMFCNTLQRFNLIKREEDDVLSHEGDVGITRSPKPYQLKLFPRK
ncbi:cytochrome P450 2U1-like [Ylistrum balloti]|uniref:cytochrome P450 2U1-like n=1 Tax=Ylistrum balloti TaxID=509963 RepID=UPI00290580D7|nr:cytochrome P450 2U1-like [Ylistrum balloti]